MGTLSGAARVVRLAAADLWLDRRLALCTVLAMASVLAPLVVMAGLRDGVVSGLRATLLQDPRTREISSAANRPYPADLLARIAARPDVAFLVPRTRTLSAVMPVRLADASEVVQLELIASAPGDPLLAGGAPAGPDAVVLSAAAAASLHAAAGSALVGDLVRLSRDAGRQVIRLPLRVQAVAAPAAFSRPAAFIPLALATFIEDYQDGTADALPDTNVRAVYAGFRLYARRLEEVPALDAWLRTQGLEIASHAEDVANLLSIDRSLGLLLLLVGGLGGFGYLLSLGATLWAAVERKRAALAMLRFLGMRAVSLASLPMLQAAWLALLGSALALGAAWGVAGLVNHLFVGTIGGDRPLCRITTATALDAAALTVAGAMLAALAAAARLGRIEPWEGIVAQ